MDTRASIRLDATGVLINGLLVDDHVVAAVLSRHDGAEHADLLSRMLAVGARGLASMGLGLDLDDVDRRVKATVEDALSDGRRQLAQTLTELKTAIGAEFDPERRSSVVARCMLDLETFRTGLAAAVDPTRADSHTAALLTELKGMLGAGGLLEGRLRSALDPDNDGSALAGALKRLEQRMDDLHSTLAEDRGRRQEATRGTAKGFGYEDDVEIRLREWARPRGAVVERTSTIGGNRGSELVGDFVVEMPDGARVVLEAKNCASLSLNGASGILVELKRAMDNRTAQVAVCLSRTAAFPREVGNFGVYGNAILVVDDDEGTMLAVAMAWAVQQGRSAREDSPDFDLALVTDRIERIRNLAGQLSTSRRALTDIVGSVEKVRGSLDGLRLDLLEASADIGLVLRPDTDAKVLPLSALTGGRRAANSPVAN